MIAALLRFWEYLTQKSSQGAQEVVEEAGSAPWLRKQHSLTGKACSEKDVQEEMKVLNIFEI